MTQLQPAPKAPLKLPLPLTLGKGDWQYGTSNYIDISTIFNARTSDGNDVLPVQIQNDDGTNYNLSNSTVSFVIATEDGKTRTQVPNTCRVTNMLEGTVDIVFPFGVFAHPGTYTCYVVVTDSSSQQSSIEMQFFVKDGQVNVGINFDPLRDDWDQFKLGLTGDPDFKAWKAQVDATSEKQALNDQAVTDTQKKIADGEVATLAADNKFTGNNSFGQTVVVPDLQLADGSSFKSIVEGLNDLITYKEYKDLANSSDAIWTQNHSVQVASIGNIHFIYFYGIMYLTHDVTAGAAVNLFDLPDNVPATYAPGSGFSTTSWGTNITIFSRGAHTICGSFSNDFKGDSSHTIPINFSYVYMR